jgi:hypothetical protein
MKMTACDTVTFARDRSQVGQTRSASLAAFASGGCSPGFAGKDEQHEGEPFFDTVYLPPGVPHSISNTGLADLIFIVATSPVTDEKPG